MSFLLPTSMPRVGSSRMITRGLIDSHLASTTFCWLPPDSTPAAAPTSGTRMPRLALLALGVAPLGGRVATSRPRA